MEKIKDGARVAKVMKDEGDYMPLGAKGRVLGSIGPMPDGPFEGEYGYFVKWDDSAFPQVFVMGRKIMELGP